MSRVDELLAAAVEEDSELGTARLGMMILGTDAYMAEPHIIIRADRTITVPDELKRLAVEHDHNIETVTFDCPRYWDNHDMSKMKIYINYLAPEDEPGFYIAENIRISDTDDMVMHFDWTISRNVTQKKGSVMFLVCAKKTDESGEEINHWNSELSKECYISEGLEAAESVLKDYPDIITQLLVRMDYVEGIATPASMKSYIEEFLTTKAELPDTVKEYLYSYMATHYPTTEDVLEQYVSMYLDEHPPLIVVGPDRPSMACLWFNTGKNSSGSDSSGSGTAVNLLADETGNHMYAEVDGAKVPAYNFVIE